jgi:hypothetical protein
MNTPSVPLPTLGFIGLGNMGGPMAARLAQAGYPIVVFDIAPDAVQTLVSKGARAGTSARDVGEQAQIVFCCLPRPEVSIAVAAELRGSMACRVLVEMSTVGRSALAQIAQACGDDIELLDCPISGGVAKAVRGDLSAIVAGPETLVARVSKRNHRPLLVGKDPAQVLGDLLAVRGPCYAEAPIRIVSGNGPHDESVTAILEALHRADPRARAPRAAQEDETA